MNGNNKAGSKQTQIKDKQAEGHLLKKSQIAAKLELGVRYSTNSLAVLSYDP